MVVDADIKVTSMGFEMSNGVMHIWATIEGANGSKLYEKRTKESLEAYGKSYCWERVGPVTGEIKGWLDPADWCLCDNPEPSEVEKYEFTSTS